MTPAGRGSLRAVPNRSPYRDGVYVRVSAVMGREDERFLSPDLQRAAINRARAAAPGPSVVVGEWCDIDVSGRSMNRKDLNAALEFARAGGMDRLWVLDLSRWARVTTEGLAELEAVERAGCRVMSTAEPVELGTPEGYFSATLMLAVAKLHSDQIGRSWRRVHEHRLGKGLTSRGGDRFGYRRSDEDSNVYEVDPVTGPILEAMYGWFLDGHGFTWIARHLNGDGVRTLSGGPWRRDRVTAVLDSGFGAGLIVRGRGRAREWLPGRHPMVIGEQTWTTYQQMRGQRRTAAVSAEPRYELTGLIRCGDCQAPMHATKLGVRTGYGYVCSRWAATKTECRCVTVTRAKAEAAVRSFLADVAADIDQVAARERKRAENELVHRSDADDVERRLKRLDRRLGKLTEGWTDGTVPDEAYRATRDEFLAQRGALVRELGEARARAEAAKRPVPGVPRQLLEEWEELPVAGRRDILADLVQRVEVVRPADGRRTGRSRVVVRVVARWGEVYTYGP